MQSLRLLSIGLLVAALTANASTGRAQLASGSAIVPLTSIQPDGTGYLTDPQPIRRAPSTRGDDQYLSGTTKAVVRCSYPLRARSCDSTPIRVDAVELRSQMTAAHVTPTNFQNIDIFQGDDGSWQAAVTIGVHSDEHEKHWTVIAHAHPTSSSGGDGPPLAWTADALLAGAFTKPEAGNYDGKYYEEASSLYLLYVRNTRPAPAIRNEIVLQPMRTFTQGGGPATTLLTTGDRYGELNSEQYANTQAKLVEAPWIAIIGGKHALIYSTGSYLTSGYKAGVAWSDGLLPSGQNGRYRKVLQPDPLGIWHSAGGKDVRYLVQSERPRWPNFIGSAVTGPGVAAAVRGPEGAWWLFLNGFAPGDLPDEGNSKVDGSRRSPFAIRLRADVPAGRSVADVSDVELATWLAPIL